MAFRSDGHSESCFHLRCSFAKGAHCSYLLCGNFLNLGSYVLEREGVI
jgi:hypothetical protein